MAWDLLAIKHASHPISGKNRINTELTLYLFKVTIKSKKERKFTDAKPYATHGLLEQCSFGIEFKRTSNFRSEINVCRCIHFRNSIMWH